MISWKRSLRTNIKKIALCAIIGLFLTGGAVSGPAAFAQEDGDEVSIGKYRKLFSTVLNEDRLLLVCLPEGYDDSDMSYPVLYVLYGNQVRGYFAEAVHHVDRLSEEGTIPRMIIVGVANVDRYRDLRPFARDGKPGGAKKFLSFCSKELVPFVEKNYRTKNFRILVGPQAGATFALYSLGEEPG